MKESWQWFFFTEHFSTEMSYLKSMILKKIDQISNNNLNYLSDFQQISKKQTRFILMFFRPSCLHCYKEGTERFLVNFSLENGYCIDLAFLWQVQAHVTTDFVILDILEPFISRISKFHSLQMKHASEGINFFFMK